MKFRVVRDYNPHTDQFWYYVEGKRWFWWTRISGALGMESHARKYMERLRDSGLKTVTDVVVETK